MNISSEFENEPALALINLGKMMRDLMLMEYANGKSYKTREAAMQEIEQQAEAIRKMNIDINNLDLPKEFFAKDFNQEALPAYLDFGKLTYEYLQTKGEGVRYEDLRHYILQAFAKGEPRGEASKASLQALLSPLKNPVDLFVLLGQRGLQAFSASEDLPQTSKKYSFWKSKESLKKDHLEARTEFLRGQIEPLYSLIKEAEMDKSIGLGEKFNEYLENNMKPELKKMARGESDEHSETLKSASQDKTKTYASLYDYFDSPEFPINEKHRLRDGYIDSVLSTNEQSQYVNGQNLIELYEKNIDLEKFSKLAQVSEAPIPNYE